jgi:hypothetical protein
LIISFCSYEFFPKFIQNLANEFFHKIASIYEHFDKKINLNTSLLKEEIKTDIKIEANVKVKRIKFQKISNWLFRTIFLSIAFIVIVFWDFFWNLVLKHFLSWIKTLNLYDKFSFYIQSEANKYFILFVFILLFLILEYFGIYSAVLFASGNILLGLLFYAAKFLMVFPLKILYKEGHDKLVSIIWFKRRKDLVVKLLIWFESTSSFLKAKSIIAKIRNSFKSLTSKIRAFFQRIKRIYKKDKQYRFLFEFRAYKRLLRMRRKVKVRNAR